MLPNQEHMLEYVDAYLHDVLVPADRARVEAHCEECRICQTALDEARRRLEAFQSLPVIEAPESLILRTERRIDQEPVRRFHLRVSHVLCTTAAAILLGLGSAHLYYLNLAPSPWDLRVLGQTEVLADTPASLRVVLLDRRQNRPLANVPVVIELAGRGLAAPVQLASLITDAAGTVRPQLKWPDWQPGEYELRVTARAPSGPETIFRPLALKRSWRVLVSTDKPVYQPGQTIHVRSLALRRPDLKPVAGEKALLSISDPRGNVIFREQRPTSRFGIAWGDCPLADEILHGPYQVTCEIGGTRSTAAIEVKPYVLPKFKVAVSFDRPWYAPGDTVTGTVRASYFFGKPVENAAVDLSAGTGADLQNVANLKLKTDAAGLAPFEFPLPLTVLAKDAAKSEFSVEATVRDTAGQQESRTETRTVAAQPIQIQVLAEGGQLLKDRVNILHVLTTDPNGRPLPTRVTIEGIAEDRVTDELGRVSLSIRPKGDRTCVTSAVDPQGRRGLKVVTLKCDQSTEDFLLQTNKAVYAGGGHESMFVSVTGAPGGPIFLDVLKDGQTIATDTIAVSPGAKEYVFDLPPELGGALELCAYRFTSDGIPISKRRVVYVHPATDLAVQATADRPEYRPGDKARVSFTLTDAKGRPAPGALSLAMVDEAVFSVLGNRRGSDRTQFLSDDRLLKPVRQISLWTPGIQIDAPAETRARYEQAVFASTAVSDGQTRTELMQRLKPYLDGSLQAFRVLERPDWEEIAPEEMPEELRTILRGQTDSHSLSAATYPVKASQTEKVKRQGLAWVGAMWGLIIGGSILMGIIALILMIPDIALRVLGAIVLFVIVVASLTPAVQSAREASRRASARNDLRQIELAFENFHVADRDQKPAARAQGVDAPPRVREHFPETLLWRPELITDDQGRASLELDLADSITTWKLSASAVTAAGALGATEASVRVFQPFFVDFNLPVSLTRGDEVTVPVVVSNFLDKPQEVALTLAESAAFELMGNVTAGLSLAPREVRSVGFRLRAKRVGRHTLEVTARGSDSSDALRRVVDVVSDGQRIETLVNGSLEPSADVAVDIPTDAIEGSVKGIVKLYPTRFSQVLEGMEGIFQAPHGCFEQTSSTTYPNVLALDYLRRTGQARPAVEARARGLIHLGYQRLLGFEVPGGGFDWFGNPPANTVLSAYGLMEFQDMARVHDIDSSVLVRTREWLLKQLAADGSWDPEIHRLAEDPAHGPLARLTTTAYIAQAVYSTRPVPVAANTTLAFLLRHEPSSIPDAYTLALVAGAIQTINLTDTAALPYLERLESLKSVSEDGKLTWWKSPERTLYYGSGRGGDVESTAMAVLALLRSGRSPATVRGGLAWLIQQKDAAGTWGSTQATVLSLRALLAAAGRPLANGRERRIDLLLDGQLLRQVTIPAVQDDVVQQLTLSSELPPGPHRLALADRTSAGTAYQVSVSYHVPRTPAPASSPLAIRLDVDRTELAVGETLSATATVENTRLQPAPMLMVGLPIPPGFELPPDDLAKLAAAGTIDKYQLTPTQAVLYLRTLPPRQPLSLPYRLRATLPAQVELPPALAWEYYTPERKASSDPVRLEARVP